MFVVITGLFFMNFKLGSDNDQHSTFVGGLNQLIHLGKMQIY